MILVITKKGRVSQEVRPYLLRTCLCNIDIDIPRDALVVFTGVSGSGKSSLAFGTCLPRRSGDISNPLLPLPAGFSTRWIYQRWIPLRTSRRHEQSQHGLPPGAGKICAIFSLHPSDVDRLVAQLDRLVGSGNTVILVEHEMRMAAASDWIIDMGPGAGEEGGRIVAAGTPAVVQHAQTYTAPYLRKAIANG